MSKKFDLQILMLLSTGSLMDKQPVSHSLKKLNKTPFHMTPNGRDQNERLLATVWVDDRNINRELVAEGLAWVFDRYWPPADLVAAEKGVKKGWIGLWKVADPVRPATWRASHPRQ